MSITIIGHSNVIKAFSYEFHATKLFVYKNKCIKTLHYIILQNLFFDVLLAVYKLVFLVLPCQLIISFLVFQCSFIVLSN